MSQIQKAKNIIPKDKLDKPLNHNNNQKSQRTLLVKDLGWTQDETRESYYRLKLCEDDWNIADMDVYDEL